MKFFFIFTFAIFSFSVQANEIKNCVETAAIFLNLKLNEGTHTVVLNGQNENGICQLTAQFNQYESGLTHKEATEIKLNLNVEFENGRLMKGVWASLDASESLKRISVQECSVQDNKLVMFWSEKDKFGWKKSHKNSVKITNDSSGHVSAVEMSSSQGIFGRTEKANCFQ